MRRALRFVLAGGFALWLTGSAFAHDSCVLPEGAALDDPGLAVDELDHLINLGCFDERRCGSENDPATPLGPLCRTVAAWEAGLATAAGQSVDARASATADLLLDIPALLTRIQSEARGLAPDNPGHDALVSRLEEWRRALFQADRDEVQSVLLTLPAALWQPAGLRLFPGEPDEIDFANLLESRCTTPDRCLEALEGSTRTYTLAVLARRLLEGALAPNRTATLDYVTLLDERWDNYFAEGRGFYPWEELLNSVLHERRVEEQGFIGPPRRQVLLLHPSAALAYRDGAADRLDEALVLELLGLYRWRWEGAEIKRPFGASLAASWTGAQGEDPGLGVLLHFPRNWSIGATYADNADEDFTVLLSVDLAKWLEKKKGLKDRLEERLGDR